MTIFVSGSIYGGTEKIDAYKVLIKELEKYGKVINTQIADPNTIENEVYQTDEEIYNEVVDRLVSADVIFAEVTIPSLGVGYELGLANQMGKRIIAIYDENYTKKVSTMIRGNEKIKLISYKNLEEIIDKLEEIL